MAAIEFDAHQDYDHQSGTSISVDFTVTGDGACVFISIHKDSSSVTTLLQYAGKNADLLLGSDDMGTYVVRFAPEGLNQMVLQQDVSRNMGIIITSFRNVYDTPFTDTQPRYLVGSNATFSSFALNPTTPTTGMCYGVSWARDIGNNGQVTSWSSPAVQLSDARAEFNNRKTLNAAYEDPTSTSTTMETIHGNPPDEYWYNAGVAMDEGNPPSGSQVISLLMSDIKEQLKGIEGFGWSKKDSGLIHPEPGILVA